MSELGIARKSDLAKRAGLSRSYIGNIINETAPTESGQYNLSPEAVGGLAKALEIPESDILRAMSYIPATETRKRPATIAEFLEVLERAGIDFGPTLSNLEGYTEDDFEELIERIKADLDIMARRKR